MAFQIENQRFGNSAREVLADSSVGAFMAGVYRWMFVGLGLTAGVAFYTATNVAMLGFVRRSFFFLMIAEFGLVFGLSLLARKLSGPVAGVMFLAYSALNGLTLSSLFLIYRLGSLGLVFSITAATFGALALYGTFTKRDLSPMRQFLFIGLIGIVVASVVNLFVHSSGLTFIMSCAGVLVFGGLTAYDNQKIRQMAVSSGNGSVASLSVVGALILYLDFLNLFLSLLQLFGGRRRD